jgi:hypothetical protein
MNRKSKSAQERTRKRTVRRKRKRRRETDHSWAGGPAKTQWQDPHLARQVNSETVTAQPPPIPTTPALPIPPNTRLSRREVAAALTAHGFRVAALTLATKAVRGGGPPYERFGKYVVYVWGPCLEWARSRLQAMGGSSTSDQKPHYTTTDSPL